MNPKEPSTPDRELLPEQLRAHAYLEKKGTAVPAAALRRALAETFRQLEAILEPLPEAVATRSPGPGEWSVAEVVDHLAESHRRVAEQLRRLLAGEDPGPAVPAYLRNASLPPWPELLADLKAVHAAILAAVEPGSDDPAQLEAKVPVAMVLKIDGETVEWTAHFDWKAATACVRVHTLEHIQQVGRILGG